MLFPSTAGRSIYLSFSFQKRFNFPSTSLLMLFKVETYLLINYYVKLMIYFFNLRTWRSRSAFRSYDQHLLFTYSVYPLNNTSNLCKSYILANLHQLYHYLGQSLPCYLTALSCDLLAMFALIILKLYFIVCKRMTSPIIYCQPRMTQSQTVLKSDRDIKLTPLEPAFL